MADQKQFVETKKLHSRLWLFFIGLPLIGFTIGGDFGALLVVVIMMFFIFGLIPYLIIVRAARIVKDLSDNPNFSVKGLVNDAKESVDENLVVTLLRNLHKLFH